MKKTIKLKIYEIILIVAIPSLIMSTVMGTIIYNRLNTNGKVTTTNNKYVNEFIKTYNKLLDDYYEDLNENELVDAAINGMLSYAGDDYTIYMDDKATEDLEEQLKGTYEGIGVRIKLTENFNKVIYEVLDNTPAKEAGLKENDILIKINDTNVEEMNLTDTSSLIKTSENSTIKIEVKRDEEILTFNIERKTLIVPKITSSLKEVNNKKIGYIKIEQFSSTIDQQFASSLANLEKESIDSLIIDLRNNTGGYLTTCTNIIKMFLKEGDLMYTIKSKTDSEDYIDDTEMHKEYKVVVLINGSSASASEILASALHDSYNATLVGTKSYGKGKVQTTDTLEDGTMIKYTSAKWYRPNGLCIDEEGIIPDVTIELDENYINNPTEENDNQLNEAIKILEEN